MKELTLEKFEEAAELVRNVTLPTNLEYSESLSSRGGRIYLKPENMQYTGAYKVRGAYYKIATLTDEQRAKGLIAASPATTPRVWPTLQRSSDAKLR